MTLIAYFCLLVAVGLFIFLGTGHASKTKRDFYIMTGVLFLDVLAGALLALDFLGVL